MRFQILLRYKCVILTTLTRDITCEKVNSDEPVSLLAYASLYNLNMCTLKLGVPQKRLVTSSKAAAKYPEERVNKPGCSANHKDILKGAGIPKLQQIQKRMISQMLLSFFGITAQYLTFPVIVHGIRLLLRFENCIVVVFTKATFL